MNLLIVDDHAGVRALIREIAADIATDVRECASGEEAIELCQSYSPDFVTIDLRMGAMNGLTAAHLLRPLHPHACIAIVTAFDHQALRGHALAAGVDLYLNKDDLADLRRHLITRAGRR